MLSHRHEKASATAAASCVPVVPDRHRDRRGPSLVHRVAGVARRAGDRGAARARAAVAAILGRKVSQSGADADGHGVDARDGEAPVLWRRAARAARRRAGPEKDGTGLRDASAVRSASDVDRLVVRARRDRRAPGADRSGLERAMLAVDTRRPEALSCNADRARGPATDRCGRDLARSLRPSRHARRPRSRRAGNALRRPPRHRRASRAMERRAVADSRARLD